MAGKPTVKGSRCDIDIDMELRTRTYIRGVLPSRATWRRRMLQVYNWASYADSRLYTKLVNCWPMLSNLALGVLEKLGPWPNSNAWSNKATSCWLLGLPCLSSVVCRLSPVACRLSRCRVQESWALHRVLSWVPSCVRNGWAVGTQN